MRRENEETIVAKLAEIVALEYGVHHVVAKQLHTVGALHDVGKSHIAPEILHKPGKLTAEEFEVMKTHTTHGAAILSSIKGSIGEIAVNISKYHHERWDGKGYWGKYACELPIYVQIISLCDVFCALLSNRCYKPAWPPKEAIEYIRSQAGTQFNPKLTEVFIKLVESDDNIKELCKFIGREGESA